ncbi:hypothetical protein KAFR_0G03750 [Kazachstania africana CBS 2517]|uniref:Nuclear control of ATPase protein 2 n=1 Tax=Kazachstania africana (strain ATCC 22294 / BCRC 22015 / CBS 2517 / CECT 1963 / NBRC 1671 / NRRL Y-8276) TaxID=1071382 RepID=H2AYF8_KAZAF|nr:hypothetical protein KAFR_0G03750 [Kazachstania africana CBS 2517]CCF59408.1 hypothetical protein KAFR_0G03750 [Kazachstania africana CBS 2517]
MLFDRSVLDAISRIDIQLESSFEHLTSQKHDLVFDESTRRHVGEYQDSLQHIKNIVANFQKKLSNEERGRRIWINFEPIFEISHRMESVQCETVDNPILHIMRQAIEQYILVLCFYVVLNESLVELPMTYESQLYYETVMHSKVNKLIYLVQASISRTLRLTKLIWRTLRSEKRPSSFTSFYDNEIKPVFTKVFMLQNYKFVGITGPQILLNLPGLMINNEIRLKLNKLNKINDFYTEKLGELIDNFHSADSGKECLSRFFNDRGKTMSLTQILNSTKEFSQGNEMQRWHKPGIIERYWPLGLIIFIKGPSILLTIWNSKDKIIAFVQENILEFTKSLITNWIWIPVKRIWATVKHDTNSEISMMSSGTLETEMDSLYRMLSSFYVENVKGTINEGKIYDDIKHGNLNDFMKIYESQMQKPIKNIVNGELIKSILIQIQKTKVDGSLALDGVDQILKSQELLFELIALSPSILLVYLLSISISRLLRLRGVFSNTKNVKLQLSKSLNKVEKLLNNDNRSKKENGILMIEISKIYSFGKLILPRSRKLEWVEDLEDMFYTSNNKLHVLNRLYHVYGKYL